MNVALIDYKIKDTNFENYLREDVVPIYIEIYDKFDSLLEKIKAIQEPIKNIVIAQHSRPHYLLFGFEQPIYYADARTWQDLKNFLIKLKELGVETVDFLACMLYLQRGVREMFATLEAETGLNLRASTDDTGNQTEGGDWIMESDMINIEHIYFTSSISQFKHVFAYMDPNAIYLRNFAAGYIYLLTAENNTINGYTFTHKVENVGVGTLYAFTGGNVIMNGSTEIFFLNGSEPRTSQYIINSATSGALIQLTGFQEGWNDSNDYHFANIQTDGGTMYFNNVDGQFRAMWVKAIIDTSVIYFRNFVGSAKLLMSYEINYHLGQIFTHKVANVPAGVLYAFTFEKVVFNGSTEVFFLNGEPPRTSTLLINNDNGTSGVSQICAAFQQGWTDDTGYHFANIQSGGGTIYFNNDVNNFMALWIKAGDVLTSSATVPHSPVITSITSLEGEVTVNFIPDSDGGSPITKYKLYYSGDTVGYIDDISASATSQIITNLTADTYYDFNLTAFNEEGESEYSNTSTILVSYNHLLEVNNILSAVQFPYSYGPYTPDTPFYKVRYLIFADDLLARGIYPGIPIKKLRFNVIDTNGVNEIYNLSIKIGETSNNFGLVANNNQQKAIQNLNIPLTTVLINEICPLTTGLNIHVFSEPYYWTGNNLIIELRNEGNDSSTIPILSYYYPDETETYLMGAVYNPSYPSIFDYFNFQFRPFIEFEYSDGPAFQIDSTFEEVIIYKYKYNINKITQLSVTATGGSSVYTYDWIGDGIINVMDSIAEIKYREDVSEETIEVTVSSIGTSLTKSFHIIYIDPAASLVEVPTIPLADNVVQQTIDGCVAVSISTGLGNIIGQYVTINEYNPPANQDIVVLCATFKEAAYLNDFITITFDVEKYKSDGTMFDHTMNVIESYSIFNFTMTLNKSFEIALKNKDGSLTRGIATYNYADDIINTTNNVGLIKISSVDGYYFTYIGPDSEIIITLLPDGVTAIPCFAAGTLILTPNGEKPIEKLKTGSLIVSADGRTLPITLYSSHISKTTAKTAPYCIPAKTFGSTPTKDLIVSPKHAVQSKKNVWQIPEFYNKAKQLPVGESISYYHIELPNYFTDNIIANGAIAESLANKQIDRTKTLYSYNKQLGGFIRNNSNAVKSINKH